jgi:hypothetical protein
VKNLNIVNSSVIISKPGGTFDAIGAFLTVRNSTLQLPSNGKLLASSLSNLGSTVKFILFFVVFFPWFDSDKHRSCLDSERNAKRGQRRATDVLHGLRCLQRRSVSYGARAAPFRRHCGGGGQQLSARLSSACRCRFCLGFRLLLSARWLVGLRAASRDSCHFHRPIGIGRGLCRNHSCHLLLHDSRSVS